jgi:di/tricarboxylate transporter
MMPWLSDSSTQWAIYALIIVVVILGLISIYLSYMILAELKEMKLALERVGKLLESVG